MERMKRNAEQLDRAVARAGLSMDTLGNRSQQKQIGDTDRVVRNFGSGAQDTERKVRNLHNEMDRGQSRWARFRGAIKETGILLFSLGKIIQVLKFPAMGAAVGIAAQAIGALAGGVIALLPQLFSLSGVVAALGPTLVGMGLAMVTVKLATKDLSAALGGNAQALKRLTPEAKAFVQTLRSYHIEMQKIRESAQKGLFPGLEVAITRFARAIPMIKTLVNEMGKALGGVAAQAGTRFTSQGFLADFAKMGETGTKVVSGLGRALITLVSAFRHIAIAAAPFTLWLVKGVEHMAKLIEKWAIFGRDSGKFGAWLDKTRSNMQMFGRILHNIWTWFQNLGRAAGPLGRMLWHDVEKATGAWAKMTGSITGQIRLTREFTAMRPAIREIVTLFDDLVRALFDMGSQAGLAGTVHQLDLMIPKLKEILNALANAFGPPIVALLDQLAKTLETLLVATGPFAVLLTFLTGIFKVINSLTRLIPHFGQVMASAFAVVGVGLMLSRVQSLATKWWAVATGARAAAAAEGAAIALAPAALGATGLAAGAAGAIPGAAAAATLAGGEAVTAGGLIIPASAAGAVLTAEKVGLGAGAKAIGGRVAQFAGKFALPVMAAMGAYGAVTTPGSFRERVGTGLSKATFGVSDVLGGLGSMYAGRRYGEYKESITPRRTLESKYVAGQMGSFQDRIGGLGGESPNFKQLKLQIDQYRTAIKGWQGVARPAYQDATNQLRTQLGVLLAVNKAIQDRKNQESRALGYKTLRQEGQAFDIYAKQFGAGQAGLRTNADVLGRLQSMQGPGRRILAANYLAWLDEEQKGNKKLLPAYAQYSDAVVAMYRDLGIKVKVINGELRFGTAGAWKDIKNAMVGNAAEAAREVAASFTAIQNKAVGVLLAMGFAPGKAHAIVQAVETGGAAGKAANQAVGMAAAGLAGPVKNEGLIPTPRGKALGGRIAGTSRFDNYAYGGSRVGGGELVVNRHTERKANFLLAGRATLGGLVAAEHTPHSFATGGRMHGGIVSAGNALMSNVPGLSVTSTTGGQHAANSYHYRGEAEDIGGSPGAMAAGVNYIMRSGLYRKLVEGIHNPGLSVSGGTVVPSGFWGAKTWAGHRDHIHLAVTGGKLGTFTGGGAYGGTIRAGQLLPPSSTVPGLGGIMSNRASALMAGGMAAGLNKVPWFGEGGTFRATRPQVIGVGDRDEVVSITPTAKAGRRGGSNMHVAVTIQNVNYNGPGDLRNVVRSEVGAALLDLADEFDSVSFESDPLN
jgi:hypothetical protein